MHLGSNVGYLTTNVAEQTRRHVVACALGATVVDLAVRCATPGPSNIDVTDPFRAGQVVGRTHPPWFPGKMIEDVASKINLAAQRCSLGGR